MSNVLIGIIGVILFIGLALAGALFLGPRFQEATLNSKASAYMEAMRQTAHAAELYRLQNGAAAPMGGAVGLVGGGYLKVAPQNPVWPAAQPILVSRDGTFEGNYEYVIAGMPGSDAFTGYCVAINRGLGIAMPGEAAGSEFSSDPSAWMLQDPCTLGNDYRQRLCRLREDLTSDPHKCSAVLMLAPVSRLADVRRIPHLELSGGVRSDHDAGVDAGAWDRPVLMVRESRRHHQRGNSGRLRKRGPCSQRGGSEHRASARVVRGFCACTRPTEKMQCLPAHSDH